MSRRVTPHQGLINKADDDLSTTAPEAATAATPAIDAEATHHAIPNLKTPAISHIHPRDDTAPSGPSHMMESRASLETATAPPGFTAAKTNSIAATATSPRFLSKQASTPRRRVTRWHGITATTLIFMLGLLFLYVQRDVAAQDAQWRPWMIRLCAITGCTLAPWRELSAFHMLEREVHALAGRQDTLQVRATFRNDAAWPQPLPNLHVNLSDADGRLLLAHVFEPAEYLPEVTPNTLIPPGHRVQASALLKEPDTSSVAFAFEFHWPLPEKSADASQ